MIYIITYGIKYGEPPPALDHKIDCRGLFNPHTVAKYKKLTGLDAEIRRVIVTTPPAIRMLNDMLLMIEVEKIKQNSGEPELRIGLFCVGGKHRSVAIAEELVNRLQQQRTPATVLHRDLEK